MLCPSCHTRNPLGRARCQACGHAFTRAATAGRRDRTTRPVAPARGYGPTGAPPLVAAPRPQRRRRTPSTGCLLALAFIASAIVLLVVGLLLVSQAVIQPMVRDRAVAELRDGIRDEVATQVTGQLGAESTGAVVITEGELNQRLAGADLAPLDAVAVEITPAGLVVALEAYQLSGTYHAEVVEQDGAVALRGGDVSGPLALVIPDGELEAAVNAEIAAALSDAGYVVDAVALEDGAMTLTVLQ